jgi:hypothetical protein
MSFLELNSGEFHSLAKHILGGGHRLRFQASGTSMQPFIQHGDVLEAAPLSAAWIKCGEVVLLEAGDGRFLAHRVIKIRLHDGMPIYLIKGDSSRLPDGWFQPGNLLGRVEFIHREGRRINLTSHAQKRRAWLWARLRPWASQLSWLPVRFRQLAKRWLWMN